MRKELLKKLREYVASGKNITCEYISYEDGNKSPCYCAVGYLMKECNFNFDDKKFVKFDNGSSVGNIWFNFDMKEMADHFTLRELEAIQSFNDGEANDELIDYIDRLIEQEDKIDKSMLDGDKR